MCFSPQGKAAGPAARFLTEPGRMGRTFEAARERGPRQMTIDLGNKVTKPGLHGPRADIARQKSEARNQKSETRNQKSVRILKQAYA